MKKSNIFLFLAFFSAIQAAPSDAFTLPKAQDLQQRLTPALRIILSEAGVRSFFNESSIIRRLAGKTLTPVGAAAAIELAIADYSQTPEIQADRYGQDQMNELYARQQDMLEAIFSDQPAAIQDLEDRGVIRKWQL